MYKIVDLDISAKLEDRVTAGLQGHCVDSAQAPGRESHSKVYISPSSDMDRTSHQSRPLEAESRIQDIKRQRS
jgi:hypothetical protein